MAKRDIKRDQGILEEARKRWKRAQEATWDWRLRFLADMKFRHGDSDNGWQWPDELRAARAGDNRPCLTMNLVRQHNLQISNTLRQSKSSVSFVGLGNGASQESANVFKDLYRQCEWRSNAQAAYTLARNFQIDGGLGFWRVVTDYASDDTFEQEFKIRPVLDPLSVYLDPDRQELVTGTDSQFAFVFDMMPKDDFDDAYPKFADLASGSDALGEGSFIADSMSKDDIMVCEYFRRVPKSDKLLSFMQGGERRTVRASKLHGDVVDGLLDDPLTRSREIEGTEIQWFLVAGQKIIDETIWPGSFIPLIPCVGEVVRLEGKIDYKGHTRAMKDAQRMYNVNAALALDTPIPTPNGWTHMGELKVGDLVFGPDGKPVPVAEVMPVRHNERCLEITFDNGYTITTDEGHIWEVEERGKRKSFGFPWRTRTTTSAELVSGKHFIRTPEPLALDTKDLPIDPYVLGIWLGDGDSAGGRLHCHESDTIEQKDLIATAGFETSPNHARPENDKGDCFTILGLRGKLAELNLLNNKHVPFAYLRGSEFQRLSLLQGLFDSDGHSSVSGKVIFINTNEKIVRAVLELCASLGLKTHTSIQPEMLHENMIYKSKMAYRVEFTSDPDMPVFRLWRKLQNQTAERKTHWRRTKRVGIKMVRAVDSVPVRCIKLDTPEHLYLCGRNMIPTHNSAQVEFVGLQGKTPWIVAKEGIEELETIWNTANRINHAVLPYNHLDDAGNPIPPPQRVNPPNAAPAYEQGMQTAWNQMMMTSGQWQNQMGQMGNERTGAAIGKRQAQSDVAVFHFQDNYEDALQTTGRMFLELVPKIYDTKRVLRLQAEDGTESDLAIDPSARQAYFEQVAENNAIVKRVLNPQIGDYSVAPSVGPALGNKREETRDALSLILSQNPGLTAIVGDLLLESMDFDKAHEAAQRLKRMIPPQALGQGPTANEQQMQQTIQQLQGLLSKSLQKQGKDQLKLVGKEQMRDIDVYDSETKRMAALQKMLPMDEAGLRQMIQGLVQDTLQTHLGPIIEANANDIDPDGAPTTGSASDPAVTDAAGVEPPPMPGARKAPDGNWYLADPTRRSKYLKLAPLAQQRSPGGQT